MKFFNTKKILSNLLKAKSLEKIFLTNFFQKIKDHIKQLTIANVTNIRDPGLGSDLWGPLCSLHPEQQGRQGYTHKNSLFSSS